jgi:cohesin complex subunit SA-1/2
MFVFFHWEWQVADVHVSQMTEQALNLLNLHIIWKARGLTADGELSTEEIRSRETLREQMDALLEKLVEYAVGTQSNTAEGVKRTVSSQTSPRHMNRHAYHVYLYLVVPNPTKSPYPLLPVSDGRRGRQTAPDSFAGNDDG